MKNKIVSLVLLLSMLISVVSVLPVHSFAASTPYTEGEQTAPTPVGAGTDQDPYRIYTKTQLCAFAEKLSAYPDSSAILMNDISFNEGLSFSVEVDTGLVRVSCEGGDYFLGSGVCGFAGGNTAFDTEASSFGGWYGYDGENDTYYSISAPISPISYTPMATDTAYTGSFDGQGHSISGIWCVSSSTAGLFASIESGATVKNLTVSDSLFMTSSVMAGAIAGKMYAPSALKVSITNCENDGSAVIARNYSGGIVGYQDALNGALQGYVTVKDSVNRGDVAAVSYAGGIVGSSSRGNVGGSSYALTANYGTVYAAEYYAGGIISNYVNGGTISNCYNAADIYAKEGAAGIAARSNRSVTRCVNEGNITAQGDYASGIVGHHSENNAVTYCANIGSVRAQTYAAGITVGTSASKRAPRISECYNIGSIEADVRAAGIVCVALFSEWDEGGVAKSVFTTVSSCVSTDSACARTIEADPICPYFDAKAPAAVASRTVSRYYVTSGAYAFESFSVFRQNMQSDSYPVPTANAAHSLFKRQSIDGFVYYSNDNAAATHSAHINENGDCRCDVCAYTYVEKHTNLDGDCICDVCGESDGDSHTYTKGGLCSLCGALADGVSALAAGSLLLSDTLRVALYMKLSAAAAQNPKAYAKIKLGSSLTLEVPVADAKREGEYHVFFVTVGAKQMNDEIKIQICGIKEGNGTPFYYSVAKYLDSLDKLDPTLSGVTEALRLWGGAAQIADGYNKNDIISEGLTVPDIALPSDKSTVKTGGIEGLEHKNTSIAISEKFTLRFVFTGVEGVTFLVNGRRIAPFVVSESLGTYAVEITGVGINELEREFTLTALKGGETYEVTHSLAAEICKRIRGGNSQEKHLNLYRSLLNLTAVLKNLPSQIVYEMNGGTITTELYEYSPYEPTPLPREGMSYKIGGAEQKFIGWFSDAALTRPIGEIPSGFVGAYRVYAKWSLDFAALTFDTDKTYSDAESENGATFSAPTASGAVFSAEGGKLKWSASAMGSSITVSSIIGKINDNLTADRCVSYKFALGSVAMAASFGIAAEDGMFFELFRTDPTGKILVADTELPCGNEFCAVISLEDSTASFYGADGELLLSGVRLISAYNSSISLLISSAAEKISDTALTVKSLSAGSLDIDSIVISRSHAYKLNHIEYELGGGSFVEGARYPEAYATEGEPTKLPEAELLVKTAEGGARVYAFGGWYADRELTLPIEEISIYSFGIVKVYARWNMVFLNVDYDTATDPDVFESTASKSADGLTYGVYGGVGTYKVFEDEGGEKYMLAATENNGSQIIGKASNKFSEISSPDLSISFEITLSANGFNERRGVENIDGGLVEYTDIINEANLTDTYIRLRAPINGKNTDLLYVFKLNTAGTVKMGSKVIAQLDLENPTPVTLRIVADFKNGNLLAYDSDGKVTASESFALAGGASTYEQMLRLLNSECFCMRLNTDNSAIRLYSIKVEESNIFEK